MVAGESGEVGNPGTLGMTTRREPLRGEDRCQGPGRPFARKSKKVRTSWDDKEEGDGSIESNCWTGLVMGPFNLMKNASVQQLLSIEPLPSPFCHPERSRGICSSTDPSWKCLRLGPKRFFRGRQRHAERYPFRCQSNFRQLGKRGSDADGAIIGVISVRMCRSRRGEHDSGFLR